MKALSDVDLKAHAGTSKKHQQHVRIRLRAGEGGSDVEQTASSSSESDVERDLDDTDEHVIYEAGNIVSQKQQQQQHGKNFSALGMANDNDSIVSTERRHYRSKKHNRAALFDYQTMSKYALFNLIFMLSVCA